MDKKFYWLKLKRDFFKRHDIKIIEGMEDGKEIVLFYIKLLVESIDHDGRLRFNEEVPYSDSMLAAVFDTRIEIVKKALETLIEFEMVEKESDGTIVMTKFTSFAGAETESAVRKREQRNLPTLRNGSKRLNGSAVVTPDGKVHRIDEKRYGGNGMLALDRALGRCEVCGSKNSIVVHHNNGYSVDLDDLVVLCSSCHGKAHSRENNGHLEVSRPPYVQQLSTDCPTNVQRLSAQSIEYRDKSIENRVERNTKERKFTPPTLEEVKAYCQERNSPVDAQQFFEYYEVSSWKDSKGNPVKNWKQKLITWEKHDAPVVHCATPQKSNPYEIDWSKV